MKEGPSSLSEWTLIVKWVVIGLEFSKTLIFCSNQIVHHIEAIVASSLTSIAPPFFLLSSQSKQIEVQLRRNYLFGSNPFRKALYSGVPWRYDPLFHIHQGRKHNIPPHSNPSSEGCPLWAPFFVGLATLKCWLSMILLSSKFGQNFCCEHYLAESSRVMKVELNDNSPPKSRKYRKWIQITSVNSREVKDRVFTSTIDNQHH